MNAGTLILGIFFLAIGIGLIYYSFVSWRKKEVEYRYRIGIFKDISYKEQPIQFISTILFYLFFAAVMLYMVFKVLWA